MPSPQGQSYITVQELKSLGLSAQFANSPLLTNPFITNPWVADTDFVANSLITPIDWTPVVATGGGAQSDVTPSGTPLQEEPVEFAVLITTGGALGVATFQFSFDGGTTFSPDYVVEASVELAGTGVTLAFDNVTFTLGAEYSSTFEDNGFFYASLDEGTTGGTQPVFPATQGATVVDGTVTWFSVGVNTVQSGNIIAASEYCDGFLRSKFGLSWPLTRWGFDLKMACAQVAAYYCACVRGFNPALPAEDMYRLRYDQATKWLKDVASGVITPDVTTAQSQAPGAPDVALSPLTTSPNFPPVRWRVGTRGSQWR